MPDKAPQTDNPQAEGGTGDAVLTLSGRLNLFA